MITEAICIYYIGCIGICIFMCATTDVLDICFDSENLLEKSLENTILEDIELTDMKEHPKYKYGF